MNVFPMTEMNPQELFTPDRDWLMAQPRMSPWSESCAQLLKQLDQWLTEYCQPLGTAGSKVPGPDRRAYWRRLWSCWSYHWRTAAEAAQGGVDGWEVARQIRAGQGYLGKGRLGGDVLREVVLAEAVGQHDNGATIVFTRDYKPYLVGMARRVHASFREESDWWPELLDKLAGYTRPPGKLAAFAGKSGLQNWLGTVVRLFLCDRLRRAPTEITGDDRVEHAQPDDAGRQPDQQLIADECLGLFQRRLQEAFGRLATRDRTLLFLIFGEGLSGKETAAVLKCNPGNVSRRKDKVLDQVREALQGQEERRDRTAQAFQDCLEHLLAGPTKYRFAQLISEALREVSTQRTFL